MFGSNGYEDDMAYESSRKAQQVTKLKQELSECRKERDILLKAVEFYADPENWEWENNDMSDDYELIGYNENGTSTHRGELGKTQYEDYIGGKTARSALKQINKGGE